MITANDIEILLVEDDPNDAELTLMALRKYHFDEKVLLVKDGEEALEFITSLGTRSTIPLIKDLKLIILDLKLPKLSGFDVLRHIKSQKETKLIPVVILTSSAEEHDIERSYLLGANSYIVKPLDYEKYLEVVGCLGSYWMTYNCTPFCNQATHNDHGVEAG